MNYRTTVIQGGLVVNATAASHADVVIENGRVTALISPDSEVARRSAPYSPAPS